jgi:hypothetical protein
MLAGIGAWIGVTASEFYFFSLHHTSLLCSNDKLTSSQEESTTIHPLRLPPCQQFKLVIQKSKRILLFICYFNFLYNENVAFWIRFVPRVIIHTASKFTSSLLYTCTATGAEEALVQYTETSRYSTISTDPYIYSTALVDRYIQVRHRTHVQVYRTGSCTYSRHAVEDTSRGNTFTSCRQTHINALGQSFPIKIILI